MLGCLVVLRVAKRVLMVCLIDADVLSGAK